jgi:hypothetical protein
VRSAADRRGKLIDTAPDFIQGMPVGRHDMRHEHLEPSHRIGGAAGFFLSMILSEIRFPPRIKSGAGFFGIMR